MSVAIDTTTAAPAPLIARNPFKIALVPGTGSNPAKAAAADEDLRALQQVGMKVRFARNETIFNDGDDAAYCYKVISGAVRLCKHMVDGRRQIADFLLAGEVFGFLQ